MKSNINKTVYLRFNEDGTLETQKSIYREILWKELLTCLSCFGASRTSDLQDGLSCVATTASLSDILVSLIIWPVDVDALGVGL